MGLRKLVITGSATRLLGGAAMVNGCIWLLLWFSGIAARWSAEGVITVKTNMALCQLLAGAGLVLLAPSEKGELRRRAGVVLGAVVAVTGALTLIEHLFGYNIGIDQLLASEPSGAVATVSPNRMGPPGSASLILVGSGLLFLAFGRARPAAWLGLCVCVVNLIPAIGFLYGISGFYSNPQLTGISWPSVVALLSAGAGLILARPGQGPAAQLLRDDAGGILLRRVAPVVIVVPLVMGYLRVQGESRGWYDATTGTGTMIIAIVLGFLWILWRTAAALSRTEEAKGAAEAKLREKVVRYRRLFDDDLTGDFISTPEGRILLCNPAFARMFGFASVEEAIGTDVADLYVDPGKRTPLMERVRREGKIERLEVWRKRRDGAPIYIVENVVGYFDEQGELYEVGAYLFDDTARRRGEEALRESEKRFATLVGQAPVGIFETDAQGDCIFVNDCWQTLAGLSEAEAAGKGWLMAIHPEDRERVSAEWYAAAEAQREFSSEYRLRTPGGEVSWAMGRAKPIWDDSGKVVRYLGTLLDITERKRAEQLGVLEDVFRVAPSFLHVLRGPRYIFEFANEAYYRLVGQRELIGRPAFEAVPEAAEGVYSERLARVMATGEAFSGRELPVMLARTPGAKPEERIIDLVYLPLKDAVGTCTGVLGHGTDVTEYVRERRRVEEALRDERDFSAAVLDTVGALVVVLDTAGRIRRFNRACTALTGYTEEEVLGRPVWFLIPPEDLPGVRNEWNTLSSGSVKGQHENQWLAKDGTRRLIAWSNTALMGASGKVEHVIGTGLDITERRRAEEALQESAARMARAQAIAHLGSWELDVRTDQLTWSDEAYRIFGFEPQSFRPSYRAFLEVVHPEDRVAVDARYSASVREGKDGYEIEHRVVRAGTREVRVVHEKCEHLLDVSGRVVRSHGMVHDITERRRAEEALERSQARLTQGVRVAGLGIFEHDHLTDVIEFSPVMRELLGLGADEKVTIAAIIEKVVPEDREELAARIKRAHDPDGDGHFEVDYRVLDGPGRVRWVTARSQTFFEGQGKERRAVRTVGAALDVTVRKESEARLERLVAERTAKLQELVGELEHFSYTITHDMRAPLRAMQGFAEMLDESWGSWREEESRGFLQRIRTSAGRMDALITDALNYSRAVGQELTLAPVDVGVLLRGMLDSYPEFQPSKARIDIAGEIPLVMGNEAGLTQCFSNLLGNAVKFAKAGEQARIKIWAELVEEGLEAHAGFGGGSAGRGSWVRIWVEDQGVGIPESMLSRVFDMFARGHQSYEGTGIGLALVRKVVQRMGGRVGVKSVEGQGSRFWVELRPGDVRSAQ